MYVNDMLPFSHSLGLSVGDDLGCLRHIIPTEPMPCHVNLIKNRNKDDTRM
jgi:hypothetical protein